MLYTVLISPFELVVVIFLFFGLFFCRRTYNGLDIQQSRWFIKISIQTWLAIMMEPCFADWLDTSSTPMPTPLGLNEAFIKRLYSTECSSDSKVQAQLEKQMGLKYRDYVLPQPRSGGRQASPAQCCTSRSTLPWCEVSFFVT
jgi:hypothetical protein